MRTGNFKVLIYVSFVFCLFIKFQRWVCVCARVMVFVCGALKHFAQVLSCSISFSSGYIKMKRRLDSVFLGDVKLIPFYGVVYLN